MLIGKYSYVNTQIAFIEQIIIGKVEILGDVYNLIQNH